MRALLVEARALPPEWVEEVILQSYLFAGFPRTLNAAREWRRISGRPAPLSDADADATVPGMPGDWRARGEITCSTVHGALNVGASPAQVSGTLDALSDLLDEDTLRRYRMLWGHVRAAHSETAQGPS